jgi:two-component system response regulator RegA
VARLRAERVPELVLLDVCLPDGTALDVLDALEPLRPLPALVALSGASDAATAFQLAQRGVRVFVQKPLCAARVREAVRQSLTDAPDLTGLVRAAVGRVPIHALEEQVRDIMLHEALARAEGNRRAAARLLSVSRQLLQHMIRAKS